MKGREGPAVAPSAALLSFFKRKEGDEADRKIDTQPEI